MSKRPGKKRESWSRIRSCETCERTFLTFHKLARFCSDKCRFQAWSRINKRITVPRSE